MLKLDKPMYFDWDVGNINKSLIKHGVTSRECEELLGKSDKVILVDRKHSLEESRFIVIGKTARNRLLFLVFTLRGRKIRVVSARDLNRKEYRLYEERT